MKKYNLILRLNKNIIENQNYIFEEYVEYEYVFNVLLFKHMVDDFITYKDENIYIDYKLLSLPKYKLLKIDIPKYISNYYKNNNGKPIIEYSLYEKIIAANIIGGGYLKYNYNILANGDIRNIFRVRGDIYPEQFFILRNIDKAYNDYVDFLDGKYSKVDVAYDVLNALLKIYNHLGFKNLHDYITNYLAYHLMYYETEGNFLDINPALLVDKYSLKDKRFPISLFIHNDESYLDYMLQIIIILDTILENDITKYYDKKSKRYILNKEYVKGHLTNTHITSNKVYVFDKDIKRYFKDILYDVVTSNDISVIGEDGSPIFNFLHISRFTFNDIIRLQQRMNKEGEDYKKEIIQKFFLVCYKLGYEKILRSVITNELYQLDRDEEYRIIYDIIKTIPVKVLIDCVLQQTNKFQKLSNKTLSKIYNKISLESPQDTHIIEAVSI